MLLTIWNLLFVVIIRNFMNKENLIEWNEHEQSTYTYIGRNDSCVNWMLSYRKQKGLPPPKTILFIGSGAIEPFTVAALPLASRSEILAVEINPDLVELGDTVRQDKAVAWSTVAEKSQHPDVINAQLTDPKKLSASMQKLASLGSLGNLGNGFNSEFFRVAKNITDRVTFIPTDALSAFTSLKDIDIIGDFFVQVNINKDLNQGIDYTNRLVAAAVSALSPEGSYVIGDSGRNMPITLNHIATNPDARLNMSSLVHVINQEGKYSSSYYSVVGKRNVNSFSIKQAARHNIKDIAQRFNLFIKEESVTVDQLAQLITSHLYFGFVGDEDNNGTVWYSQESIGETLSKLASKTSPEFSEQIIFPK